MHSPRGMTLVGAFLQLTLSSDKISTLRRPILLLKLDLVNEEGKREEVTLELDDAELKELVNELGDVNKVSHTVGGLGGRYGGYVSHILSACLSTAGVAYASKAKVMCVSRLLAGSIFHIYQGFQCLPRGHCDPLYTACSHISDAIQA